MKEKPTDNNVIFGTSPTTLSLTVGDLPQKEYTMAARPATLLESILGVENAKACLQEIEARIHPEDTSHLRHSLIQDILYRHIQQSDLSLKEVIGFLNQPGEHFYRNLIDMLTRKVYNDIESDYQVED